MKNKKGKGIAMTVLSLGFALLFVGGIYLYTQKQIEPTTVYEFAREMPVNTQIQEGDLRAVNVPASAINQTMELDKEKIVGKYNNTKVFNGEYVMTNNLVEKEEVDPFESMDLTKLRQITIPANYVDTLGGDIQRGDKIDLIYVGAESKDGKNFTYSRTIMTGVLVYATNTDDGYRYINQTQNIKGQVYDGGEDINGTGETGGLGTVTLAVTLEQAEEISSRMATGDIQIVGRFLESEDYDTSGYINGDYEKVFSGSGSAETN